MPVDRPSVITLICIAIAFVGLFAWFYWPEVFFAGPGGIHYIRQTDSLAFIAHFRNFSSNLFTPGVLDLRNAPQDGLCAGEFPLFYWAIGMVERWLGDLPYLLKGLNLLLVLTGHVLLTRAMAVISGNALAATGLGMLFFGSGVLSYYACNFLPDAGVYGLVLIGWSIILPGVYRGEFRVGLAPVVIFTLAGLIKAPAAMHLIALVALDLFESRKGIRPNAPMVMRKLLPFGLGVLCILGWHVYVNGFNKAHGSNYFMTWAEPIWNATPTERGSVMDMIWNYWWARYLHPTTWHVLILLMVVVLARHRSIPLRVLLMNALLLIASACFVMLFFRKFADHDYYFLTVLPALIMVGFTGVWALLKLKNAGWWRWSIVAGIWALAISSVALAHLELQRRNSRLSDEYSRTALLVVGLADKVGRLHLPLNARVIVLGDSTTNGALLALGRRGWAFPGFPLPAEPPVDDLIRSGASHILYLGGSERLMVPAQMIKGTSSWSLWRITERSEVP